MLANHCLKPAKILRIHRLNYTVGSYIYYITETDGYVHVRTVNCGVGSNILEQFLYIYLGEEVGLYVTCCRMVTVWLKWWCSIVDVL